MLADEKVMPEKKPTLVLLEEEAMSDEKMRRRKTSRSRSPPPGCLRGDPADGPESGIATGGEHVDKMSGCAWRRSVYTTIATCRARPPGRAAALRETCFIWQPCKC